MLVLYIIVVLSINNPLSRLHAQEPDASDPTQTVLRVLTHFHGTEIEWPSGAEVRRTGASPALGAQVAMELARSASATERARGIEVLSGFAGRDALRMMAAGLIDPSEEVQAAAVRAVNRQDPERVAPVVVEMVINLTEEQEASFLKTAPELDKALAAVYLDWLSDENGSVDQHVAAAYLLGKMRVARAADLLARRAWARDALLAERCAQALAELSSEAALPHLQELTRHPLATVRIEAVRGLGTLDSVDSLHSLVEVVQGSLEPENVVRREAILQIGRIRRPDSVHVLMNILSTNRGFRIETTTALTWLTGKGFGRVSRPWQEWYNEWLANPVWPVPKSSGIEPLLEIEIGE